MHYFKFHISDYYANTGHLSDAEDLCYRRLLDYYYLNNGALPDLKTLAKKLKFSKREEIVEEILNEFFVIEDGVFKHSRADKEMFDYNEKSNTNKRIAVEREEKRRALKEKKDYTSVHKAYTTCAQDVHEASPNHKPLTINQEPLTINQSSKTKEAQSKAIDASPKKKRNVVDWDWTDRIVERFGVSEQVARDFITARKVKRAVITETVLSQFQSEVKKVNDAGVYFGEREAFAYWVASGWQGFKADWYLKAQNGGAKTGYKTKETIEECMSRLSTSESARAELDVTPSKNGLGLPVFDYLEDSDPFAYQQQNNA